MSSTSWEAALESMQAALSILPQIAGHPVAIVAFVLVVGAFLWTGMRIRMHRGLQTMIAAIPENQRLKAIEAHLGHVRMKSGLSPEEFLRSRIHAYVLWAFMATLAAVVVVVALVVKEMSNPKPDAKPKVEVTG